jgi:hypothetical protein
MLFNKILKSIYESLDLDLPQNFNPYSVDSCMYAAELLTKKLLDQGKKDFQVIEGFVKIKGVEGKFMHTWIETPEGKIDPTIKQFFTQDHNEEYIKSKVQYIVKKRYKPEEYQSLCSQYPVDPSRHFIKEKE